MTGRHQSPARRRAVSESWSDSAQTTLARVVIGAVVVVWTLPLAGVLVNAVRPADDAATRGWWTIATDPSFTLEGLRQTLGGPAAGGELFTGLLASLAIAGPATVATVVVAAAAAYAFAWGRFPGREWGFLAVVSLALLPLQMVLIPLVSFYADGLRLGGVQLVPDLGLAGSWVGLWLAHTAFGLPVAVLLLRGAMGAVPAHLIDAARTDGASHLDVFARVVVPLSVPALAAVATLQFLWVWNDFLVASTLLGRFEVGTAPVTLALADLVRSRGEDLQLLSAATVVTIAIPLVLYAVLARWITDGTRAATFDQ